ncbi:TrbG/VirB9 family P-type conjugative transfer protein [Azospirillum sp. YIM DDC1]|uniref:TrbG/VirB9 family P-type conjugative transfer protein n=2 Tax=Azospirillum aestuarii TaxID=2802052 RepID=A0ABS1I5R7_9PROT|nr:TrbG/VirB9 family P-type conjugative transfer protein [Azospirillum aestuarii]
MTFRAVPDRGMPARLRHGFAAVLLATCALARLANAQAVPPGLATPDGAPLPGLIDSVAEPGIALPKPKAEPAGSPDGGLTLPRPAERSGGGATAAVAPSTRQPRGLDADAQNRGDYPVLQRSGEAGAAPEGTGPYQEAILRGISLGRIQPAWDDAVPAPGQIEPGTVRFAHRVNRVMPLRLRLGMTTSVVLPPCETISRVSLADEESFPWEIPDGHPNLLLVRPDRAGVDTAMQVIARSGRLYTFYLRSETVKAAQVTDLTAFIDDDVYCARSGRTARSPLSVEVGLNGAMGGGSVPSRGGYDRASLRREERVEEGAPDGGAGGGDFATVHPFRVEDLSFDDIRVFAPDEASRVLGPLRAFHDGRRTFLDYGERLGSTRLPAAFLLVGGVDQPVAVRWGGSKGQILIIDAVGDLTLKSGDLYLCVRNRFKPAASPAATVDAALGRGGSAP